MRERESGVGVSYGSVPLLAATPLATASPVWVRARVTVRPGCELERVGFGLGGVTVRDMAFRLGGGGVTMCGHEVAVARACIRVRVSVKVWVG
mgnify:CR=1 FL=1